jgi:hypothetical protein
VRKCAALDDDILNTQIKTDNLETSVGNLYLYFTYTTSTGNNYDLLGELRMSKRACDDGQDDDNGKTTRGKVCENAWYPCDSRQKVSTIGHSRAFPAAHLLFFYIKKKTHRTQHAILSKSGKNLLTIHYNRKKKTEGKKCDSKS